MLAIPSILSTSPTGTITDLARLIFNPDTASSYTDVKLN
jgi:hypothetical protein